MHLLDYFPLDPEEYPHPTTNELESLHEKYAAFEFGDCVQVRAQLERPGEAQHKVEQHCDIVYNTVAEEKGAAKTKRMARRKRRMSRVRKRCRG